MKSALIGYTGFVGGSILSQRDFDSLYNSKNIAEIQGKKFNLIVSAGARAEVWKANQNPEEDWRGIQDLIHNLEKVEAGYFVLISTVDVYPKPYQVDENTSFDPQKSSPYGRHRFLLEEFVRKHFPTHTVVRLPGLFGPGIKKNFIFDLIHNNRLDLTHCESMYQYYNLKNIWKDIQIALEHLLPLVNFATEPVKAKEVAKLALGMGFTNVTENPPKNYDTHTIYGEIYKTNSPYLYFKGDLLEEIKEFILQERAKLG